MQHIVVDLEFTPVADKSISRYLKSEVIEIGAVRLDESFNIIDEFDLFVRPEYTAVNCAIFKLTGIGRGELEMAPAFDEALDKFREWIGSEPFRIYQWSENDRAQIVRECLCKGLTEKQSAFCGRHWRDIQRLYARVFHKRKRTSLKSALEELAFDFDGRMHRACDDARNTAQLLRTMVVKECYEDATRKIREVLEAPKKKSTLGELPGIDLDALLSVCDAS